MGRLIEFATAHPWLSVGVVGSLLAAMFNEVRLRALSVTGLAPNVAVQAINKGAAIFDLREPAAFGQGHIPNARNMRAVGRPGNPELKSGKTVLLVCDNGAASGRLAQDLPEEGLGAGLQPQGRAGRLATRQHAGHQRAGPPPIIRRTSCSR